MDDINKLKKYFDAANYLSAIQIYLKDNFLLKEPLKPEHIKPRLLGHWGTCPGINFLYTNLNYIIKKHNQKMLFIVGPGHGFAAIQANLFIEETLAKYYPQASANGDGLGYIAKQFSWPYGYPSHSNPGAPGVILEGGELGYALSTAYGSVLDNPDLISVCMVGDGEAETGPTATAWHLNKLVHPAENGVVLPVLHLNEYKISGPTIYGRMSNDELIHLFKGYGYEPLIVEYGEQIWQDMQETLEKSLNLIKEAKKSKSIVKPRLPMIILKTPKGWTGIKELDGKKIEGNYPSHQVVGKNAKTDEKVLSKIEEWFKSYNFNDLFTAENGFIDEIKDVLPDESLRMGNMSYANPSYHALKRPDIHLLQEKIDVPGSVHSSSMIKAGEYFKEIFKLNRADKNFRLFSPDETYSNKLDAVFDETERAFTWPIKDFDEDISPTGRVMEMLSEHSLQGMIQGYTLTGRHGVFTSYEAFIQIVTSMADQYIKFIKTAREIEWRNDLPSIMYLLSSSGWRQEHNGFSHQNPGFVDDMLQRQYDFVKVFFPYDANSTLVCVNHCLQSKNGVNVITVGKTFEPNWLPIEDAERNFSEGMSIWDFASDENPDVVIAAVGDYMTKEALAAISIIKEEAPLIKIRFINITELSRFNSGNQISQQDFDEYFTKDKPVIFNFHGYPETLKQMLFDYKRDCKKFYIHGYIEKGSTTTPFDMQLRNKTSRYNLAIEVFEIIDRLGINTNNGHLINKYNQKIEDHKKYIIECGVDPDEIDNWVWAK